MTKHPFDVAARQWIAEEKNYFSELPQSTSLLRVQLDGSKRTYGQVKDWRQPGMDKIIEQFKGRRLVDVSKINFSGVNGQKIYHDLFKYYDVPDTIPDLGYFELYPSAKPTDFIMGSFLGSYGHIVSKRAKEILASFNLGVYMFYQVAIRHKGVDQGPYYFLRTKPTDLGAIDYSRTSFFIQDGYLAPDSRTPAGFDSMEAILAWRDAHPGHPRLHIRAMCEYLRQDAQPADFFRAAIDTSYYVSIQLAMALEQCTGVSFQITNRVDRC